MSSERECDVRIEVVPENIMTSEDKMSSEQVRVAVGLNHGPMVEVSG